MSEQITPKDASQVMQEAIGKKLLAIKCFEYESIGAGTFVIILTGMVEELYHDIDGNETIVSQMQYRIIPFNASWAQFLFDNPHKVAGYGLTISTGGYANPAQVLVNDELLEVLIPVNDYPF